MATKSRKPAADSTAYALGPEGKPRYEGKPRRHARCRRASGEKTELRTLLLTKAVR